MLNKEDFVVIKALNQHGVYLKDIAAELSTSTKIMMNVPQ
jgi:hypothetical protein